MDTSQPFDCFVINLDQDIERYNHIEPLLAKQKIANKRVSAINGKELSEEEISVMYDTEMGKRIGSVLNRGEIGCAMSHMSIYKNILAHKQKYTLILEDDIVFPENFKDIVTDQIKKNSAKENSWEYLSFDYFAYGFDFLRLWFPGIVGIIKNQKTQTKKAVTLFKAFVKLPVILLSVVIEEIQKKILAERPIKPIRSMFFTGAYIVTLEGAQKLVDVYDTILYTSDRLPNIARKERGLNFYIYNPLVVRQLKESFPSNIHQSL